jgi:hypothetical protein
VTRCGFSIDLWTGANVRNAFTTIFFCAEGIHPSQLRLCDANFGIAGDCGSVISQIAINNRELRVGCVSNVVFALSSVTWRRASCARSHLSVADGKRRAPGRPARHVRWLGCNLDVIVQARLATAPLRVGIGFGRQHPQCQSFRETKGIRAQAPSLCQSTRETRSLTDR